MGEKKKLVSLRAFRGMRSLSIPAMLWMCMTPVHADDWPQWRGPDRDAVWNETGTLDTFPQDHLLVRWRADIGIGFSSPIVADGRVFVTDSELAKPEARERVHAFDAMTGEAIWTYSNDVTYPDTAFQEKYRRGPIATPIVMDGRIYTLGAAGKVLCLDSAQGTVLWQKDLEKEYPAGELCTSPSPLLEGGLLIVFVGAQPGANVIALDKNTGEQVWKAIDEGPSASSPIVVTAAGVRQLIVWTDLSVTSLAPATGTTLWRQELDATQDAAVSTPVYRDGYLLAGGSMLRLDENKPAAELLWPQPQSNARRVFSDTSTALLLGGHIYTPLSFGEFVCVEAKTGKQVWQTEEVTDKKSGASVHLTVNGESVLLYTDRGELIRAQLTPEGYREISRARVLEPTDNFNRKVAWAAPAYANRSIYARTDKELVCASLEAER